MKVARCSFRGSVQALPPGFAGLIGNSVESWLVISRVGDLTRMGERAQTVADKLLYPLRGKFIAGTQLHCGQSFCRVLASRDLGKIVANASSEQFGKIATIHGNHNIY